MKKQFTFIVASLMLISTQSCQKQSDDRLESKSDNSYLSVKKPIMSKEINVRATNGALHFNDAEDYLLERKKILAMPEAEFEKWEKSIGFKSLRTVINEAHEAFDELKTEEDLVAWQAKYKDVVELRDSTVTPLISDWSAINLANHEGEYFTGDAYVKVTPEKAITILSGDKNLLTSAKTLSESNVETGIIINHFEQPQVMQITPPIGSHVLASKNVGKRKTFIQFQIKVECLLWSCHSYVELHVYGQKKTLFGWNKHNTRHYIDAANFRVVNNANAFITLPNDLNYQSSSDEKDVYFFVDLLDPMALNDYIAPDGFASVKGRSRNRGTDNQYAVICKGYAPSYCP